MNYIYDKVSTDLDIDANIVKNAYEGFWKFIRATIIELPLKEMDESEFPNIRANFNIPSLGKLGISLDRFRGVKERFNYIKNIKGC